MHLAKPATFEQILMAVAAVYRRSRPAAEREDVWRLDETAGLLHAPDGAVIELSPTDLTVLQCLLEAGGETVSRAVLAERIGLAGDDDPNLLAATIYRLRRRIERATPALVPLQAKSRLGYAFRARLTRS
jgi:two-component system OmpR family response regulator